MLTDIPTGRTQFAAATLIAGMNLNNQDVGGTNIRPRGNAAASARFVLLVARRTLERAASRKRGFMPDRRS
ncbi:MAG: hypothetical protein ABI868_19335 [Acidobacteriota bacterium]